MKIKLEKENTWRLNAEQNFWAMGWNKKILEELCLTLYIFKLRMSVSSLFWKFRKALELIKTSITFLKVVKTIAMGMEYVSLDDAHAKLKDMAMNVNMKDVQDQFVI